MSAPDLTAMSLSPLPPAACFPTSYVQGRTQFLAAARAAGALLQHHVLPGHRGSQGEELALDAALLTAQSDGNGQAPLLIVSSGVHGVEGLCGSGCQQHLLHDAELLAVARQCGVDMLLLHAINPHGFSHLRRGNEDNIDLNRNCVAFEPDGPPNNPDYAALHGLLVPATWPPTPEITEALNSEIERRGVAAFRRAATAGQSSHPDGLFHSGQSASWSNRTVRALLREHGAHRRQIAWVDLHTGLGPRGHGEKIHAGRTEQTDLARGRRLWGADVVAAWEGQSASEQVRGPVVGCVYDECPQAEVAAIALEFGTVPYDDFLYALRADQWLHNHPDAPTELANTIRQDMRAAFYVDADDWRGMVAAQARVAVLQACLGMR
jgi:predicted deacylase